MERLSVEGLKAPPPGDHGAVAQLQWIAIADLVVDPSYQRDMTPWSRKHVEKIAAEFDWSLFSPVVAAPVAGGGFALIDGQHRSRAALLAGETHVPAMIVIADRARQAKSFAAINGQTFKMTSMAVFKAALASGDPAHVRCAEIAQACGVRILAYPLARRGQQPGDTMAAASLLRALTECGEEAYRAALTAIMASKGDKRGLVDSATVLALARLFREHRISLEAVRKAFAWIDLRAARAEALREGFTSLANDMREIVLARLKALAARPPALPKPSSGPSGPLLPRAGEGVSAA